MLAGLALVVLAEVSRVHTVFPTPPIKLRMEVFAHLVLVHAAQTALGHLENL